MWRFDMRRATSVIFVVMAVACGKVRAEGDSPDANAPGPADASASYDAGPPHGVDASTSRSPDASTGVAMRSDAGTPPDECVAPCLRELMRGCTAPRMHACYHDDSSGALCDPVTGWSLVPYDGGMAGSGLRLAHDGKACLLSSSGGASPIPGVAYSGPGSSIAETAVKFDSDGKAITMCGLGSTSTRYPYAGAAACAAWVTDPMQFECDEIVSGPCPPLVGIFPF